MTTAFLIVSALFWTVALMFSFVVEGKRSGPVVFWGSTGMLLFNLVALWPYLRFEGV